MPSINQAPPQPIKKLPHRHNVWLLLIPIIFIAVIFILYVFAWEESMAEKKVNRVVTKSKIALNNLALNSQEKIKALESELDDLKYEIQKNYTLIGTDNENLADKIGEIITIEGTITKNVSQHPMIALETETHYEYHYIDTEYGQIQALRGDRMKCDDILILTGTIHALGGNEKIGKNSYEGYYMIVQDYECLKTKTDYMCARDTDCVLQQTSCSGCTCPEIVNEENRIAIKCAAPTEDELTCTIECAYNTPKCIGGKCHLIKSK